MTGKKHGTLSPTTGVALGTLLLVFVAGIVLAPELIGVFVPACMATLAVGYLLFTWIERRNS